MAAPAPSAPAPSGLASALLSGATDVPPADAQNAPDQRLARAQAARRAEEEATLSQAAVSAQSAMNSIAMRMANKLMGQVEKIEGTSKNPPTAALVEKQKTIVSFGATTKLSLIHI